MSFTARFKKKFYFVAAGYFRIFANRAYKRWHPHVIAVTGSVGKTTMLHMLEHQLGKRAHYSHNANSAFGIAFDLVGINKGVTGSKLRWIYLIFAVPFRSLFFKRTEKYYVVEIDGERPHETEFLASWLKPEVTLWISLGRSHAVQFEKQVESGEFEDLDRAITHEFAMLPQYTTNQIYIDGDIYLMKKAVKKIKERHKIKAKVTACSMSSLKKYSVTPESTDFTIGKTVFHFASPQPRNLAIQLDMLKHLCRYLKIDLKKDFSDMPLPPGRSSYFAGKKGLKLVDSSYNAHLISMESIMDMARSMRAQHKWLVIGDMIEQGKIEGEEHTKLAQAIIDTKPEQVILVGRRTKEYTRPVLEKNKINVIACDDVREALDFIEKNATGKEVLVFKGSQYLEWLVEKLLKNPEDAAKLPRREDVYVKRREKRGLE